MARRNRYELNYARIQALLRRPLKKLRPETVVRLRAGGFMDLVCEVLPRCDETGATVLSLCHYFEQNGDLCQDPEMTVRLFHPGSRKELAMTPSTDSKWGRAEALSFQMAIPPIYQELCAARHNSCYVQHPVMLRKASWSLMQGLQAAVACT